MKKILALVLALCLTLSLSVAAFAADGSGSVDPSGTVDPSGEVTPGSTIPSDPGASKTTYSATDSQGRPVNSNIEVQTSGPLFEELKDNAPVAVYAITLTSSVDGNVTFDVYAPGASNGDTVLVRDEWEVLEGANLKVNGARATFTVPAETVRQWKYFAIVKSFNTVEVEDPKEGTEQDGESEGEGDEMSAGDTDTDTPEEGDATTTPEPEQSAPTESENPPTGVVLAVVPMVVAAAAIVISKKR